MHSATCKQYKYDTKHVCNQYMHRKLNKYIHRDATIMRWRGLYFEQTFPTINTNKTAHSLPTLYYSSTHTLS